MARGSLPAQLGVLASALFVAAELACDAQFLMARLAAGEGALACAVVCSLLACGAVTSLALQPRTADTLTRALGILRLTWARDLALALRRPSYTSVHPYFMRPSVLVCEAVLKALPMSLVHVSIAFTSGFTPAAWLSMLIAHASIAWALSSFEVNDFKNRQVLRPTHVSSPQFIALLAFRLAEVTARVLVLGALALADTRVLVALLAIELLLALYALHITPRTLWASFRTASATGTPAAAAAATRAPSQDASLAAHGYADLLLPLLLTFVFWDLPPRDGRGGSLVRARTYFALRLAEEVALCCGLYLLGAGSRQEGQLPAEVLGAILLAAGWMALLFPLVYEWHWKGALARAKKPRLPTPKGRVRDGAGPQASAGSPAPYAEAEGEAMIVSPLVAVLGKGKRYQYIPDPLAPQLVLPSLPKDFALTPLHKRPALAPLNRTGSAVSASVSASASAGHRGTRIPGPSLMMELTQSPRLLARRMALASPQQQQQQQQQGAGPLSAPQP
jgi:hypothetical protein